MSQASSFFFDKVVKGVGLTGLENLGNTCYINSTLQCLFSSSHVRAFLSDEELFLKCVTARQPIGKINLAVAIKDVFCQLNNEQQTCTVSPCELLETIKMLWANFTFLSQEDACEFIMFLLGTLHQELMTKEEINVPTDSPPDVFSAWTRSSVSFISQLCHFQTCNRVTCRCCSYDSFRLENLSNHLSVDVGEQCTSLMDCLNLFFQVSYTDGTCPSCKGQGTQQVQCKLGRLPPLLIIQLKRFAQLPGMKFLKNKAEISFDLTVDLTSFVAGQLHTNQKYKLIAVQNHSGELSNGHYFSFCQRGDKWFKFDDNRVNFITTRRLVSETAYMLWYEKALDTDAVFPFDFTSMADAILPSTFPSPPTQLTTASPSADRNNNIYPLSPDLFHTQDSPHDADLSHVEVNPLADNIDLPLSDYNNNCHPLSPGFFLNHQSPCAEQFTQGAQFTPQAQADNDRAQIPPMAKAILLPRRQEKKIEDQGTSKKLPMNNAAPEINLLEPHKCQHAQFSFELSDPVLTEADVMGAELDLDNLDQYTVPDLKRWLECRGVQRGGNRKTLVKKILDHVAQGKRNKIDPKVDEGIWHMEKRKKLALENPKDPRGHLPMMPMGFNVWKPFPSTHIPRKFDHEKIEEYFNGVPEIVFSIAAGVRTRSEQDCSSDDEVFDASLPTLPDRKHKFLLNTLGRGKMFLNSGRIMSVFDYEKNGHYFIKAMVHASMRNQVYVTMLIISSHHGDVCNCTCTCKANALGRCCHIAAALLLLHCHIQNAGHEAVTCTGRKCYWIGGTNEKDPGVVREKGSYYTSYNFKRRAYFNPIPSKFQNLSTEEEAEMVQKFSEEIEALPMRSLYHYHLSIDTDQLPYPDMDATLILSELCSYLHWNLNSIREVAFDKPFELPRTREQFKSDFWHSERSVRISASKCKSFLGLTADSAKIAYFRKNMWGFKGRTTEAMDLGIENEPTARKKYMDEYMLPEDKHAKMYQTGSWVHPDYPMLLCSPDGIIVSKSETTLFETKYCHILQGAHPKDYQSVLSKRQQSSFYLKLVNDELVLKETHPYYYQVQMSLDILRLNTCKFAVLSGDKEKGWKMAVVTVHYNESFWREKRQRIIQKHRSLLVPEYFLARTVKNLPPKELVYSEYHEDHTDPYFLQDSYQENIYYHLKNEEIADFHF